MQEKCTNKKNKKRVNIRGIIAIIILFSLAIVLWIALRGKYTETGSFPVAIKTESLTCTASRIAYEKLSKDESADSNVKIVGVFNNQERLISLAFDYTINYNSQEEAKSEEAVFRGLFGLNLADDGFRFTEFRNKFTLYNRKITLSLFGDTDNLSVQAAPYFLLGSKQTGRSSMPTYLTEFKTIYEKQGFKCSSIIGE